MDLSCQEMRDAGKGSSESLDSPRSLFSECQKKFSGGAVTAAKPFSHRRGAVTTKEKDVVRDVKEKERVRASLFELCWLASFL